MAIGTAKAGTVAEIATGTSTSVALPSGLANGDVMVLGVSAGSTGTTPPSGWSWLPGMSVPITGDSDSLYGFYRVVATATSETAPTVTQAASSRLSAQILAYSGVDNSTPFAVNVEMAGKDAVTGTTNTLTVGPSTSAPSGGKAVSMAGADSSSAATLTAPSGMTQRGVSTPGTGKQFMSADATLASSGAVSETWTLSSTNVGIAAWLVVLNPSTAVAIAGRTLARAETASAQSLTATLPTGTASGDVLVAFLATSSTAATLTVTSTGWTTLIAPQEFAAGRTLSAYLIVNTGSVTAPSMSTTSAASRQTWLVQAYTGVNTTTPQDATAVYAYSSITTNPNALVGPSITIATAGARLISLIGEDASTTTLTAPTSPAMTLLGTNTSGTGRTAGFADYATTATGATGALTWATTGTTDGGGITVALRPAAGGSSGGPITVTVADNLGLSSAAAPSLAAPNLWTITHNVAIRN